MRRYHDDLVLSAIARDAHHLANGIEHKVDDLKTGVHFAAEQAIQALLGLRDAIVSEQDAINHRTNNPDCVCPKCGAYAADNQQVQS